MKALRQRLGGNPRSIPGTVPGPPPGFASRSRGPVSPPQPIRAPEGTESLSDIFHSVQVLVEAIENRRPTSPIQKLQKLRLKEDAQSLQDSLKAGMEFLSKKEVKAAQLAASKYNRQSKEGKSGKINPVTLSCLMALRQASSSPISFAFVVISDFQCSSHLS
jgi:hypothetical protein